MDSSQVTAAIKLLGKVLPDLSATAFTEDKDGTLTALFKTVYEKS